MLVDDEDENENDGEELLKLAKVQKQLKAVKNSDDISKSLLAAVSALSDAVEDMAEAQKNNSFYDKDLGKSLSDSMTKLSESMLAMAKEQKIDLAPLVKSQERGLSSVSLMMRDLQTQNNELIKVITAKSEKPESKNDSQILKSIVETIKASNESLRSSLKSIDYSSVLAKIAERPTAWTHQVLRNENGRVSRIISKIGDK